MGFVSIFFVFVVLDCDDVIREMVVVVVVLGICGVVVRDDGDCGVRVNMGGWRFGVLVIDWRESVERSRNGIIV